jgi:hypothetical protein
MLKKLLDAFMPSGKSFKDVATEAKTQADGFFQHYVEIRRKAPAAVVDRMLKKDPEWMQTKEYQDRASALSAAGFLPADMYSFRQFSAMTFADFVLDRPDGTFVASICKTPKGTSMDVALYFPDDRMASCTDVAAPAGMTNVPWSTRSYLPGIAASELIRDFIQRHEGRGASHLDAEQLAGLATAQFQRTQAWRAERGGWTLDEIKAQRGLPSDAPVDDALFQARLENIERWSTVWLRLQKGLPFDLEQNMDKLVMIHDELPDFMVQVFWMAATGDTDARRDDFNSGTPREVVARLAAKQGGPLRRVFQKTSPVEVDFYLPAEVGRKIDVQTPLGNALNEGLIKGNLRQALSSLDEEEAEISTAENARAIQQALAHLATDPVKLLLPHLVSFCRILDTCPVDSDAGSYLREHAMPVLVKINASIPETAEPADGQRRFNLLRSLMRLRAPNLETVALEILLRPDGKTGIYSLLALIKTFDEGHPGRAKVLDALLNPLPGGRIGVALLIYFNQRLAKGLDLKHPFDSVAGCRLLEQFLESDDEDIQGESDCVVETLAFLSADRRAKVYGVATKNGNGAVRIKAATAIAKAGDESGLNDLVSLCRHWSTAETAKEALEELGRKKLIPAEALTPEATVLAKMSDWLAHPNELARVPDELEIVDMREMRWPPKGEVQKQALVRYRAAATEPGEPDDSGVGLVGSITFCLFGTKLEGLPPEEVYAAHAFWEMEQDGWLREVDLDEEGSDGDASEAKADEPMIRLAASRGFTEARTCRCFQWGSPEQDESEAFFFLLEGTYEGRADHLIMVPDHSGNSGLHIDTSMASAASIPDADEREEAVDLRFRIAVGRWLLDKMRAP